MTWEKTSSHNYYYKFKTNFTTIMFKPNKINLPKVSFPESNTGTPLFGCP